MQIEPAEAICHPAIAGLINALPAPGQPWKGESKEDWIFAMTAVLALIYPTYPPADMAAPCRWKYKPVPCVSIGFSLTHDDDNQTWALLDKSGKTVQVGTFQWWSPSSEEGNAK